MIEFLAGLDTVTLQLLASLVMLLTLVAAGMLWITLPKERFTRLWAGGNALLLVGLALGGLRDQLPAWLVIPLSNALAAMGGLMIIQGVAAFCGRPVHKALVPALGALVLVLFFLLTVMHPNIGIRVLLMSLLFLGYCVYAAWCLWVHVGPELRLVQRATALLLALDGIYYVLNASGMFMPAEVMHFGDAPAAYNATYLNAIVMLVCLIFAFNALTNRRLQLRLEHLARHDTLTGSLNRFALEEAALVEIARSRRHGTPLSVISLDLDHFKQINDRHGHQIGDEALKRCAAALRAKLRAEDVLGRIGGEEFCILLPDTDERVVSAIAERLRAAVAEVRIPVAESAIGCTTSVGATTMTNDQPMNWSDLLKIADGALYQAKRAGRDRVEVIPPREVGGRTVAAGEATALP